MKGKFKLIALPFIMAALSLGGMVGGTLAYFTSASSATVTIEAGKVKYALTFGETLKTYVSHNGGTTTSVIDADATGGYKFENGGEASISGNVLTLSHITPGDGLEFTLTVTNTSNVDTAFRLTKSFPEDGTTGNKNGAQSGDPDLTGSTGYLSDNGILVFSAVDNSSNAYVVIGAPTAANASWQKTTAEADAALGIIGWGIPANPLDQTKSFTIKVYMPQSVGNNYQGASATVTFSLEAVQANGVFAA